jgi:hypothetical protein
MATKDFGTHTPNNSEDIAAELRKLVGANLPLKITTSNGVLVGVSYDTIWQEGTTEAVSTGELDENGVEQLDYKANYKKQRLSKDQIKKLDNYIAKALKAE